MIPYVHICVYICINEYKNHFKTVSVLFSGMFSCELIMNFVQAPFNIYGDNHISLHINCYTLYYEFLNTTISLNSEKKHFAIMCYYFKVH